ncbi:FecR family protein [Marinoscillum sp.]|uniref:FecR family protein n=1 Tax=Marinoscillum sp. TaxID=2024838 RepID=UPI003BA9CD53
MDYNKYTVEDFVLDKDFREWVMGVRGSEAFWNSWLADHPEKLEEVKEAKRILENLNFPNYTLSDEDELSMFHIINQRIDGDEPEVPVRFLPVDSYTKSRTKVTLKLAVAASLLLAMCMAIYSIVEFKRSEQLAYTTDFGQTKEVTLEDGSVVILNANSKLYVAEFEESGAREVWLDGEAFFSVTHTSSDQKFIVHANKVDVNVLGTEFNVYTRGKKSQVELASGKVALNNQLTNVVVDMVPGDRVTYEAPGEAPKHETIDTAEISSWKDNLLIFRRNSLEEISELLKANYNIDVFFTHGASSDYFFTGTVPADNIDLLLTTIEKTFSLQVERKGQTVIIKPATK